MSLSSGVYRIKNAKSGTYLDASVKSPGKVHGWDSRPDNMNQQWRVEESGGTWTLQNAGSGQYLSASGSSDGTNVRTSDNPTRWNLDRRGNGYVILAQGSNGTVDLDEGNDKNGTSVNIWNDSDGLEQRWEFEQVSGGHGGGYVWRSDSGVQPAGQYSGVLPLACYHVRNVHTGTALDLSGSSPADGTRVIGYQAGGDANQRWDLESGSQGYRIRNKAAGSYLGFQSHEQVQDGLLLTGNKNPIEWVLKQADQGYQVHLASNENLVLDLASGDASDGAKICLWSNNGQNNQKWNFQRV
jgi:hypothetical protein